METSLRLWRPPPAAPRPAVRCILRPQATQMCKPLLTGPSQCGAAAAAALSPCHVFLKAQPPPLGWLGFLSPSSPFFSSQVEKKLAGNEHFCGFVGF